MNELNKLRFAREGYLVLSTVVCLAGLRCLWPPDWPPLAVRLSAGILLILYGLIRIVGYYADDLYCLAFQYGLACGLLLLVLGGIVLVLYPRIREMLLPGLGLLILIDGLLTVQTAGEARRFGLSTWGLLLAAGAAAGVLGAVLLARCSMQGSASRALTGAALLAEGVMSHCVIYCTVRERTPPGSTEE